MNEDIFRVLIKMAVKQAGQITDDKEALEVQILYPNWEKQIGKTLAVGKYIRHEGILYKVLIEHVAQASWSPVVAPSLFAKVLVDPNGNILDWEQPSSTNPYMKGDKVKYNGEVYISTVDNNVWEPTVYGWDILEEA